MRSWATGLLVLLMAGGAVEARPRHHRRHHRKTDKLANMPRGWSWPPSSTVVQDGQRCLAHLDEMGVVWQRAPRTAKIATPIVVPSMTLGGLELRSRSRHKPPHVMDCRLAEAVAAVAAPLLRDAGVTTLSFTSIHVLRNVKRRHMLSRHALGLAIDVWDFIDDEGQTHVVYGNYKDDALLQEIERRLNASGVFRGLLTPRTDPRGHRDHFHLEARTLGDKPRI